MISIPYMQETSERLAKVYKKHNISIAVKPINKIGNAFVHPKDKIPKGKQNEVIYRIPCKNCDFVYIGETGGSLDKRLTEYKQTGRPINKSSESMWVA